MPTTIEFTVRMSPSEVERRLRQIVTVATAKHRLGITPVTTALRGDVGNGAFRLLLPRFGRNSFRATLSGRYEATSSGSRIVAHATGYAFTPVFVLLWIAVTGSIGYQRVQSGATRDAWIVGGMLVFGVWLGVIGRLVHADESKKIAALLKAALHEPTSPSERPTHN